MWTRRRFLSRGSIALLGLAAGSSRMPGAAPEKPPDISTTKGMITPAAQRVIDQGLAYLAEHQNGDGSFGDRHQYKGNVAITSLAALALMAAGNQPGRGARGKIVTNALQFVLSQEDSKVPGFLYNPNASAHGPMYSHG